MYGECERELDSIVQVNTTNNPNMVTIMLNIGEQTALCYFAEASNDTFKVIVEGRTTIFLQNGTDNMTAIIVSVIVVFLIIVIVAILIIGKMKS